MGKKIDLTDQIFGRLKVLRKSDKATPSGASRWTCQCTCGNTKDVPAGDLKKGSIKSCGCYRREIDRSGLRAGPRKYSEYDSLCMVLYRDYIAGAKARALAFDVTFDQFKLLIVQPCYYCGREPQLRYIRANRLRKKEFLTANGLDRVDNKLGYLMLNIVPCCGICNRMKSNMASTDFLTHIKSIASRF